MSIHEVKFKGNEEIDRRLLDEEIKNATENGGVIPHLSSSRTIYEDPDLPNGIPSREVILLLAESSETVAVEKHIKGADHRDGAAADILISRTVFQGDQINGRKVPGMGRINELRIGNRGYTWTPSKE